MPAKSEQKKAYSISSTVKTKSMHTTTDISEQMELLYAKGYTVDLTVDGHILKASDIGNLVFAVEDVTLDQTYRFRDQAAPGDVAILYAISLPDGEKGQLFDSLDHYNSPEIQAFIQQLA